MAALTWYVTSSKAGTAHQEISETDPGTEAYASPTYGWISGTTAAGRYSSADTQTERAAATFATGAQPDGSIVTTASGGDCWRTTNTYIGSFASGNWVFHGCVRSQTAAGGTGRARFRLFRGSSSVGTGATEITSGASVGSTITNATGTTRDSTVTTALGAFSVNGEYLFVQWAWEIVSAGSMTTQDVNVRVGNASSLGARVNTPNFTPYHSADDHEVIYKVGGYR